MARARRTDKELSSILDGWDEPSQGNEPDEDSILGDWDDAPAKPKRNRKPKSSSSKTSTRKPSKSTTTRTRRSRKTKPADSETTLKDETSPQEDNWDSPMLDANPNDVQNDNADDSVNQDSITPDDSGSVTILDDDHPHGNTFIDEDDGDSFFNIDLDEGLDDDEGSGAGDAINGSLDGLDDAPSSGNGRSSKWDSLRDSMNGKNAGMPAMPWDPVGSSSTGDGPSWDPSPAPGNDDEDLPLWMQDDDEDGSEGNQVLDTFDGTGNDYEDLVSRDNDAPVFHSRSRGHASGGSYGSSRSDDSMLRSHSGHYGSDHDVESSMIDLPVPGDHDSGMDESSGNAMPIPVMPRPVRTRDTGSDELVYLTPDTTKNKATGDAVASFLEDDDWGDDELEQAEELRRRDVAAGRSDAVWMTRDRHGVTWDLPAPAIPMPDMEGYDSNPRNGSDKESSLSVQDEGILMDGEEDGLPLDGSDDHYMDHDTDDGRPSYPRGNLDSMPGIDGNDDAMDMESGPGEDVPGTSDGMGAQSFGGDHRHSDEMNERVMPIGVEGPDPDGVGALEDSGSYDDEGDSPEWMSDDALKADVADHAGSTGRIAEDPNAVGQALAESMGDAYDDDFYDLDDDLDDLDDDDDEELESDDGLPVDGHHGLDGASSKNHKDGESAGKVGWKSKFGGFLAQVKSEMHDGESTGDGTESSPKGPSGGLSKKNKSKARKDGESTGLDAAPKQKMSFSEILGLLKSPKQLFSRLKGVVSGAKKTTWVITAVVLVLVGVWCSSNIPAMVQKGGYVSSISSEDAGGTVKVTGTGWRDGRPVVSVENNSDLIAYVDGKAVVRSWAPSWNPVTWLTARVTAECSIPSTEVDPGSSTDLKAVCKTKPAGTWHRVKAELRYD